MERQVEDQGQGGQSAHPAAAEDGLDGLRQEVAPVSAGHVVGRQAGGAADPRRGAGHPGQGGPGRRGNRPTVVIIGGGSVGLETAELLAAAGKQVTVLEMLDTLAAKMVNVTRTIVLGHLKGYGVRLLTSCRCQEITDRSVIYQDRGGAVHEIPADTVVIATGDRPDSSLYEALKGKVPELYNVGDSNGAGVIAKAVNQGYYCALKL